MIVYGPHSLAESPDGRFWITNALSSTLMAYTPATHSFETFDIGADSLYTHTIRLDLLQSLKPACICNRRRPFRLHLS